MSDFFQENMLYMQVMLKWFFAAHEMHKLNIFIRLNMLPNMKR